MATKLKNTLEGLVLFLLVFVITTTFASGALAATFSMSPATATFPAGNCSKSLDIEINVTGESSSSADIEIQYDPSVITIIDADPSVSGKQIRTGNAYLAYAGNEVNESTGLIRLTGLSFYNYLNSRKIFATILFQTPPGGTTSTFTIRFDGVGATLDSNIAESTTNLDLLTAVGNGTYTFVVGPCNPDTQGPGINFIDPQNYQTNVTGNTAVITITDNQSGIDLDTVVISVNGINYTVASPEVEYTGNPLEYTFTITLDEPYPAGETSVISVGASDLEGNTSHRQIIFNIPPGVIIQPEEPTLECPINEREVITNFLTERGQGEVILGGTFLDDTFVEDILDTVGIAGSGALLAAAGLSLNLLPLLALLNTPGLILNLLGAFFGKRSKKPWGVIVDSVTGKPIAFASCRLYLAGTLSVLSQTVSDLEGRYGFVISSGSYRLEITQSGYAKFSKEIIVPEGESGYVYDVRLVPIELSDESKGVTAGKIKRKLRKFYLKASPFLFLFGFALSLVSIIFLPNLINLIVFTFYLLIIAALVLRKLLIRPKYASVIDSGTKLRIPFAIVKIFDTETWKLVDSVVTNQNGNFDFWGEKGEYATLVAVRGYRFPSEYQTGYEKVTDKYSAMLKIYLAKGKNKVQLLVDRIDSESSREKGDNDTLDINSTSSPASNLQNPFE